MVKGLFVGAKVKVVAVKQAKNAHLVGLEGVITGIEPGDVGPSLYSLDTHPIRYAYIGRDTHCFGLAAWQLEPILPQGAQPLGYSFEQMMSEFGVTEAVK